MCDQNAISHIVPIDCKKIAKNEFTFCRDLKELYIPFYVEEIPEENFVDRSGVFKDMHQIALTIFGEKGTAAEVCAKQVGVLFKETDRIVEEDTLFKYFGKSKQLVIAEGTIYIHFKALEYAPHIEEIKIPDTVEYIKSDAFANTSIHEIVIPQNVKSICSRTFKNCKNLTCVVFENGNTGFELSCFDGCSKELVVKAPSGGFVEKAVKLRNILFEAI